MKWIENNDVLWRYPGHNRNMNTILIYKIKMLMVNCDYVTADGVFRIRYISS